MSLNTTPRTWVAGEVPTAANFNTEVRDAIVGIQAAWTAYTPTLTASTTSPTLGTGSITTGKYLRIGKFIAGSARIKFGTGAAAGSGSYRLLLPVAVASTATALPLCSVRLYDNSSGNTFTGGTLVPSSTTAVELYYQAAWPVGAQTVMSHAGPWAWADLDELQIGFLYEAA